MDFWVPAFRGEESVGCFQLPVREVRHLQAGWISVSNGRATEPFELLNHQNSVKFLSETVRYQSREDYDVRQEQPQVWHDVKREINKVNTHRAQGHA